ncbi:hypothetical protein FS842_011024 [Serendipita sp. 407]|nr:hypothetical protein FRC15_010493 [Serendipita sp. 397]KAG9051796.1 hypothetical protein FS842_011024 [Serendipita sp. 407]
MPWLGLVGGFMIVSVMGLAMVLRVIALWHRSRLVKMITILLFLVYILHFIVFAVYGYAKGETVPLEISPYTGCSFNLDHRLPLYTIFISPLLFYTFIVAFTILKSYPLLAYKSKSMDGAMFRLSSVLVNDGVVYYIVLIISQVISLYATITLDADPTVVIPIVRAAPGIAVTIVACNRLFLRLHDVMSMREDEGNLARRVPNRDGRGMLTTIVSARVSAFAPMDQSMDGSRGHNDGDIRLQHPMTTNDVQLNDQLATVDYDYHAYLRKGLNHERTPSR